MSVRGSVGLSAPSDASHFLSVLVLVLLSALVKRFNVSHMRDFFQYLSEKLVKTYLAGQIQKKNYKCFGGKGLQSDFYLVK